MFWVFVAILAGGLTLIAYTVNSVYDWGMVLLRGNRKKDLPNMPKNVHNGSESSRRLGEPEESPESSQPSTARNSHRSKYDGE